MTDQLEVGVIRWRGAMVSAALRAEPRLPCGWTLLTGDQAFVDRSDHGVIAGPSERVWGGLEMMVSVAVTGSIEPAPPSTWEGLELSELFHVPAKGDLPIGEAAVSGETLSYTLACEGELVDPKAIAWKGLAEGHSIELRRARHFMQRGGRTKPLRETEAEGVFVS